MQHRTGSIYIPAQYLNQIMRPLPTPDNYKIVPTEREKGYFVLIYPDIGLEQNFAKRAVERCNYN